MTHKNIKVKFDGIKYNDVMFEFKKEIGIKEIVKTMLSMRGVSMSAISEKLKKEKGVILSQSGISKKLSTGTIRFNEVKAIADILGYEITIKEK